MSGYTGTVLTTNGRNLQAKAQIGTQLQFTKVKLGNGVLTTGVQLENLTDLLSPKLSLSLQDLEVIGDGTSRVRVLVSNENLQEGFSVTEIGLFANDPVLGEILYSIVNAGEQADYLPAAGGSVVVEQVIDLITVVGTAQNVTAVINNSLTLATKKDITDHNADAAAHGNLLASLHLWQATKAYLVGDVVRTKNSSYKYMECTVAGSSGNAEPAWPSVGQTVVDNTVTWKVCDIRQGTTIGRIPALVDVGGGKAGLPAVSGKLLTDIGGMPIGFTFHILANNTPPGCLRIDTGAEVSRATYPDLWAWVQANAPLITEAAWQAQAAAQSSVGFYSTGDGSTTFRLPRIVDFVSGTDTGRPAGTWRSDEIKSHNHIVDPIASTSVFGNAPNSSPTQSSGSSLTKAQNYTSSTGGAETRPKSVAMLYCVKAFDAPTNQALIDITALANNVAELSLQTQKAIKRAVINETQASGIHGGTFTAGAWRTRTLNTIVENEIGITLSGNQITIPFAGAYKIIATAPAYGAGTHKAKLQNITDGVMVTNGEGTSERAADGSTSKSEINTKITLSSAKTFEIQQVCTVTNASTGFGIATAAGINEIYTRVIIEKVG